MNDFEKHIEGIRHEQILLYFGFKRIQQEDSFAVNKNTNKVSIIVFNDEKVGVRFFVSTPFLVFNSKELLLFLIKDFSEKYLEKLLSDIINIDNYSSDLFTKKTNINDIKNRFLALEESDELQDTPVNNIIYKRHSKDCLMLNIEMNFIDLLHIERSGLNFSLLGNSTGIYYYDNKNSQQLFITNSPFSLSKKMFNDHSVLLTNFNVPVSDVLKFLGENKRNNVVFCNKGDNHMFFKLRIMAALFNTSQSEVSLTVNLFENKFYIVINFIVYSDKILTITQYIANVQNHLKMIFTDEKDYIKDFYKSYYKPKFDYTLLNKSFAGKLIIRNNDTIIQGVINSLERSVCETFGFTIN